MKPFWYSTVVSCAAFLVVALFAANPAEASPVNFPFAFPAVDHRDWRSLIASEMAYASLKNTTPTPIPNIVPRPVGDICPQCNGKGKVGDGRTMLPCLPCGGTGKVQSDVKPVSKGLDLDDVACLCVARGGKCNCAPAKAAAEERCVECEEHERRMGRGGCASGNCGSGSGGSEVSRGPLRRAAGAVRGFRPLRRLGGFIFRGRCG